MIWLLLLWLILALLNPYFLQELLANSLSESKLKNNVHLRSPMVQTAKLILLKLQFR